MRAPQRQLTTVSMVLRLWYPASMPTLTAPSHNREHGRKAVDIGLVNTVRGLALGSHGTIYLDFVTISSQESTPKDIIGTHDWTRCVL
jgi:hypothetical protein